MPSRQTRKARRQRGGVKLGEGAFGAVYRPPLLCNRAHPINNTLKTNRYIGKHTGRNVGLRERNKSNLVRGLNANGVYTVPVNAVCNLAAEQTNTDFEAGRPNREVQLISKYGGASVESMIPETEILNDAELYPLVMTPEREALLFEGLRAIKALAPHLREFNRHFVHNDLHFGNIVWDGEYARLIDFSEVTNLEERKAELREQYPKATEAEIDMAAKTTDSARLFELVKEIINTKYIQNTPRLRSLFRTWQFGNPYRLRDPDTLYTRLEALPV